MTLDSSSFDESHLIHDWNRDPDGDLQPARGRVQLNDETLRDGLQSPSAKTPSIEDKLRMLHYMAELGIESANIGLPGAGPHVVADVERLAREVVEQGLDLALNCAARTLEADIRPVIEISQRVGIPLEVSCFLGSSPIRQYTESWDLDRLRRLTRDAVSLAVGEGLPVMYVTEDTTRARPDDLRALYSEAVEAGAKRVCIADTVGHATPAGARNVVRFIRQVVDGVADDVQVDWHGHRDRGFSEINSLTAAAAGADRIHGTALGVGERVGNTPIDLLLVNMQLMGWIDRDLSALPAYCELVSRTTGVPLPENYPVLGRDAFLTGTGVHAAAIIKARSKGDDWLADRIYSGVPASLIGRRQQIGEGPMSGESNVVFWLREHGFEADPELVRAVFIRAKDASCLLEDEEILAICRECGAEAKA